MNPSEIVYVKNSNLLHDAQQIIETAQRFAYRAVNVALVQRNWLLGKRIADPNIFQSVIGKSEITILDSLNPKSFSLLNHENIMQ